MISAEGADGDTRPAASTPRGSARRVNRAAAPQTARIAAADPARTREKVLRIVFQPYIDERGRLHEASAVRAVVANGEWQQALGQAAVPSARRSYGAGSPETPSGRASWREGVGKYVLIWVVAVRLKQKDSKHNIKE